MQVWSGKHILSFPVSCCILAFDPRHCFLHFKAEFTVSLYRFTSVNCIVWPKGPWLIIRCRDSVNDFQVRPLYQAETELQAFFMVTASKTAMRGSCMHSM